MSFAVLLPDMPTRRGAACPRLDFSLLTAVAILMSLGLVMVASASMPVAERLGVGTLHFAMRQTIYLIMGLALGLLVLRIQLVWWERCSLLCILLAIAMLMIVLVPGVGVEVNGSTRWINLGLFRLQVSEPAKLLALVYMAGYLVRHGEAVRETGAGFIKPLALLLVAAVLLLLEPDFGATVVMMSTALVLMFMAGVSLWKFAGLIGASAAAFIALIFTSGYRTDRLTGFLNPWADPFITGYQLTQSLIAIGRGEVFGVGLGASVQKLFYLPEAHTDFVFAVLAEELGLVGILFLLGLYVFIVLRAYRIASVAEQGGNLFAAYLAYGIGTWLGLQALINVGVNTGLLPTKGLTLPLMSYGGSSMLVTSVAMAMLLRIDYETRCTVNSMPASGVSMRRRRRVQ
ncbi:Cell division protein FtsW [hydrothermal vent metagenome]|uniref:peptidoglycan glycosyltransferase n=1 Tax=hydrothermal vent metagenome TaxID=652676 RepID=A0A3B0Z2M6_9ZZZZ